MAARIKNQFRKFFELEAAGGIVLFFSAVLATLVVNSEFAASYKALLDMPINIGAGAVKFSKPFLIFINDALMVLFFVLVGAEIKRDILEGELSRPAQALLPLVCALGGMLAPALIYTAFNYGDAHTMRGWAIPAATDIAFSLGVLSLFGSRIPLSVKVFLSALAIADDLGAIIIIAVFYSSELSVEYLLWALAPLLVLILLNRFSVRHIWAYSLAGLVLWYAVLKSGVHPTVAGVVIAATIPLRITGQSVSPLIRTQDLLHPWVAYLVLPVFAFANGGMELAGFSSATFQDPVSLGALCGLLLGKPLGVGLTAWVLVKWGVCELPAGATFRHMWGVSLLAGIGFTMSLFIGMLSFSDVHFATARVGIMCGSMLSAVLGALVLSTAVEKKK